MNKKISLGLGALLSFLVLGVTLPAGQEETEEEGQISIRQVERFYYCCLTRAGGREGIPRSIKLVWQLMEDQVIAPTGPAIAVIYESPQQPDPEALLWDIGFPITPQTQVLAPLTIKRWTHVTVAEAYHFGPLNKAHETYERMVAWMTDNGYAQVGPVLEMYFTDPVEENPTEYKTRIWVPCAPKGPRS